MRAALPLAFCILFTACKAGPRIIVQEKDDTVAQPKPASAWEYKTDHGASWACAKSIDNAAELCFRREQGHLDSFIHLPETGNPFFCQRGRCDTKISIDSAAEQTVQGTDDENGSIRILFLPDPQKLLSQVEQAKQVRIKPPMFGLDQQFVFNVSGLHWK
ncbi:MAG TPA: hypothetical protein VMD97_11945 [Candidatus Aquilonibacter sp.]|nr:hypothetical protein [Candidatus Aquilonibacter sp.]